MKLMNDYSWIRGVCYGWNRPGGGKTLEDNRRELGYAKRLQINSTRIWLSYQAYWRIQRGIASACGTMCAWHGRTTESALCRSFGTETALTLPFWSRNTGLQKGMLTTLPLWRLFEENRALLCGML